MLVSLLRQVAVRRELGRKSVQGRIKLVFARNCNSLSIISSLSGQCTTHTLRRFWFTRFWVAYWNTNYHFNVGAFALLMCLGTI